MIELEKIDHGDPTGDGFYGALWADASQDASHVIAEEGGLWYVRDVNGERGPLDDFEQAFNAAQKAWGGVTLAPANRLRRDIELGRAHSISDFLLEYLATYGAVGIDVQALAQRVFERIEED